jgi:hypothetical protein
LSKEIEDILKANDRDIDGVRSALRNAKSQHKNLKTKDLNAVHKIPGYRFTSRDGIIRLERSGPLESPPSRTPTPAPVSTPTSLLRPRKNPFLDLSSDLNDPINRARFLKQREQGIGKKKHILAADEDTDDTTDDSSDAGTDANVEEKDDKIIITEMRRHAPKQSPPQPKAFNIVEEIESLAKRHTQQLAQVKADEEAKTLSKTIQDVLDQAARTTAETTRAIANNNRIIEATKRIEEENDMKAAERDAPGGYAAEHERRLREEKQAQEKRDRELEMKNRIEHHPTTEELIQTLALEQAQQKAQKRAEMEARALSQKIIHTLASDEPDQTEPT